MTKYKRGVIQWNIPQKHNYMHTFSIPQFDLYDGSMGFYSSPVSLSLVLLCTYKKATLRYQCFLPQSMHATIYSSKTICQSVERVETTERLTKRSFAHLNHLQES